MNVSLTFPFALLMSALAIRMMMPVAPRIGLVDRPGGHKQHEHHVPLVGGLGIYVATACILAFGALAQPELQAFFGSLLAGASLLFIVGLIDDIHPLGVRVRFLAQGVAATLTAVWGGIMLNDFGALLGSEVLILGALALPVTLFATAGVINALNMSDGVDGLSGSLSFVSLGLLAVIAYEAGAQAYLVIALALLGAVGGFLLFNLRCCGRPRAHVFMGDAGSTLLGFLFACLFVGLSQGETRAMSPVTALWLFAVPLYDTTATMVRRIWLRQSPFKADRWHLHHLLLDAGFTVQQGVMLMALLHLGLGMVGLAAWHQGVAEWVMFASFIGLFVVYLFVLSRPWRFVPAVRQLHRNLDLPVAGVQGIFIGDLPNAPSAGLKSSAHPAEPILHRILDGHLADYGYELHGHTDTRSGIESTYAIVHIGCERTAPRVIKDLKRRLADGETLRIRQLVPRQVRHDRRQAERSGTAEKRQADRRSGASRLIARHQPAHRPTTDQATGQMTDSLQLPLGSLREAAIPLQRNHDQHDANR